jgi:ketosteroid isomerase-like protein
LLTGFAVDQLAGGASVLDELQNLWDFQHIQALPQRYCDAIIRKDIAALAALFTADGEFIVPAAAFHVGDTQSPASEADRRYAGRKALLDMYEETFRGGISPLPSVSNIVFEVQGDVAFGRCLSTIRYANNKAAYFLAFYDDAYARTTVGWKFSKRAVRLLSFDSKQETAER